MWAALLLLAALPEPELLVAKGPVPRLGVRARPSEDFAFAVREGPLCRLERESLAVALHSAFEAQVPVERLRVRLSTTAVGRALVGSGPCSDPVEFVVERLDVASRGQIRISAERASPVSFAEVRLEPLRAHPLRYLATDLLLPPAARTSTSAWEAARGRPEELITWLEDADLVARSWSERVAPPASLRAYGWPWLTAAVLLGLPLGLVFALAPPSLGGSSRIVRGLGSTVGGAWTLARVGAGVGLTPALLLLHPFVGLEPERLAVLHRGLLAAAATVGAALGDGPSTLLAPLWLGLLVRALRYRRSPS